MVQKLRHKKPNLTGEHMDAWNFEIAFGNLFTQIRHLRGIACGEGDCIHMHRLYIPNDTLQRCMAASTECRRV